MRKLIYCMLVSLDGFIEDISGSLRWHRIDEELHRHFNELDRSSGAFLYGRRLFESMASFWPTADQDAAAPDYIVDYARIWREKPKFVFSRSLKSVGHGAKLVKGDAVKEIIRLKAEPGGDLSVGGADLAATCIRHGLIDEYLLYVNPVVLGGGKPMFPAALKLPLELKESRTFGSGVVRLHYRTDSTAA
jgi:dihydrofolate reductase